jgi:DNA-binding transcriptional regulator LsrR (DeoR family)
MRYVKVQNKMYPVEDQDDLISLTHELYRQGYTVDEISKVLNLGKRKIIKMLEDCW